MHHYTTIGKFKLELQSGKPNLDKNQWVIVLSDLKIWQMTLKNSRAPILCYFKICASFHCHMWIKTGIIVQKRLDWVLTSITLTFDHWPWPFAGTSLLSMVITPENFIMTLLDEHCEKGVTDRQMDGRSGGQTDKCSYSCLVATKIRRKELKWNTIRYNYHAWHIPHHLWCLNLWHIIILTSIALWQKALTTHLPNTT